MRVVVTQSNYLPWRGWFALSRHADLLVLLDHVQYTRRDWRNRNRIVIDGINRWLTVPVYSNDHHHQLICETKISDPKWWYSHLSTLQHSLGDLPHYHEVEQLLKTMYQQLSGKMLLTEINRALIEFVFNIIEINTPILDSCSFEAPQHRSERLLHICKSVGATTYISGPSARNYLDSQAFEQAEISIEWANYSQLPQSGTDKSVGELTILDTIARFGAIESKRLSTFER